MAILSAGGDYAGAWWCVCPSTSAVVALGNSGSLEPESEEEIWYNEWITEFKSSTTNSCTSVAADWGTLLSTVILFDGPADVTCADAVSDEIPFLYGDCLLDCDGELPTLPGTGGEPPPGDGDGADTTAANDDGGMHVYGLEDWTDAIMKTSSNNYEIDEDFVAFLVGDLSVFVNDNIGVGSGTSALSHTGFEFEAVGGDSIADALEIEEGDIVWELNGTRLEGLDDVQNAFETMVEETTFIIKLDRGSSTITKTVAIVDLSTYP